MADCDVTSRSRTLASIAHSNDNKEKEGEQLEQLITGIEQL